MNLDRLNHLVTVLEGVKAANKAFDLNRWIATESDLEEAGGDDTTSGDFAESCGTACCALGYAALDPRFQSEGLVFQVRLFDEQATKQELRTIAEFSAFLKSPHGRSGSYALDPICNGPASGGHVGFSAGVEFFGITHDASYYLFDPGTYPKGHTRPIEVDEVVGRVREVIALDGHRPPVDLGLDDEA